MIKTSKAAKAVGFILFSMVESAATLEFIFDFRETLLPDCV